MINTNDGGSAFPVTQHLNKIPTSIDYIGSVGGMTLRDYFAAAALTGLISTGNYGLRAIACSEVAYSYADAMLAARKEGQP